MTIAELLDSFSQQGQLAWAGFLRGEIGKRGGIVAGKAMIGELRPHRVASRETHGAINTVYRQKCQRICANEFSHAFEVVGGREQLVALGRVYTVIVRMSDRGRSDAEVDFSRACIAHHLHDLARRRAPHDRVVDENDPLAGDHGAVGGMLESDALVANGLRRLNERATDLVIANDAKLVGDLCLLGETDCSRHTRIGDRNNHVGLRRRFAS